MQVCLDRWNFNFLWEQFLNSLAKTWGIVLNIFDVFWEQFAVNIHEKIWGKKKVIFCEKDNLVESSLMHNFQVILTSIDAISNYQ